MIYNVIDLFAGAGGLSLGFKQTGQVNIIAAAENNPNARKTYKRNFKLARLYSDVRTIDYSELQNTVGPVDIVIGGPPCQGFSNANRQHSTVISMNNRLVKEYVRAICELKPKAFVMENVAMLRSQVHRFFLEEQDLDNERIMALSLSEDKIEILPKSVNFENSISFLETAQEEFGFAWAEGFYKIINILYRYRINPVKFDATLEKYQKKLMAQLNEIVRLTNEVQELNVLQQNDERMAKEILQYMEKKDNFDAVILAISDSIIMQRAIMKIKELTDNDIHIFEYKEENGSLVAVVKSYPVLDYIRAILENEPYDYTLSENTLNAIHYGAPQRRERFIIVGLKKDLNTKYTARIRQTKAAKWFHFNSILKAIIENTVNTESVITSCITLSCIMSNGPPLSRNPKRLAGTCRQYSKKAIAQLKAMTPISGKEANQLNSSRIFRCPYQANVMKMFEKTNNPIE